MLMFKKRRGINLSYEKQGLIHFVCVNFRDLPDEVLDKIVSLSAEVGGEHGEVLFEVMTNKDKTIRELAQEYHISETQLYYYRKQFYENW